MTADEGASSAPGPADGKPADAGGSSSGPSGGEPSGGPGLKDAVGGAFDEQAADAYEEGRLRLRLPRGVFTSGHDQEIHIGPRYQFRLGAPRAPASGPVPDGEIDNVRGRYVHVDGYEALRDQLVGTGLLVLVGAPHTGRTTTALHLLLDALTKPEAGLSRLDADAGLGAVDEESFEAGRGYLLTVPQAVVVTRPQADRLAALCRDRDVSCVAVVDSGSAHVHPLRRYVVDHVPAPAAAVLRVHVDAAVLSSDPPRFGERLTEPATEDWLRGVLGPDARPADVVALAARLVDHGRTEHAAADLTSIEEFGNQLLESEIEQWFTALRGATRGEAGDRVLRVAAYRLALAVFDGMPRHVVGDAAELLFARLVTTLAPMRRAGRPLVLQDEPAFLHELRAEPVDGTVRYGDASVPSVMLQYRDERVSPILLAHVWRTHHNLRKPLSAWLRKLGGDLRPAVRTRAAVATGLLCAVDFSYTFPALVEPAAAGLRTGSDNPFPRPGDEDDDEEATSADLQRFAAVALDHAAAEGPVRDVVVSILRRWRRSGTVTHRATAARTLSYQLGSDFVQWSLEELRVLGTPQELTAIEAGDEDRADEWDLVFVAGESLARLFARGARETVLQRLTEWMNPPSKRSLQLLAQQAVVILADLKVSAVADVPDRVTDVPVAGLTRPGRWPLLLAIVADEPRLADPVAALLRATLRGRGRQFLEDSLGGWMRRAQVDSALQAEIERFLPLLVVDESDRARLIHLVRHLRRVWADALPAEVADCMQTALDGGRP